MFPVSGTTAPGKCSSHQEQRSSKVSISMRMGRLALAAIAFAAASAYTRHQTRQMERIHPPTGRFVTPRAGLTLHYERHGKGRPIILLHGGIGQLQDMTSSLGPALSSRYEIFAFDRPGHGYSEPLQTGSSIEDQARVIADAARLLRLDKPIIVGHALGAAIALAYGGLFSDKVKGVVAISAPAQPARQRGVWLFVPAGLPVLGHILSDTVYQLVQPKLVSRLIEERFAPQAIAPAFLRTLPMEMLCRPQVARANADDQRALQAWNAAAHLEASRFPLAVFAGLEDTILDAEKHAMRMADTLAPNELHLLPGIGHMAHHFAQEQIIQAIDTIAES